MRRTIDESGCITEEKWANLGDTVVLSPPLATSEQIEAAFHEIAAKTGAEVGHWQGMAIIEREDMRHRPIKVKPVMGSADLAAVTAAEVAKLMEAHAMLSKRHVSPIGGKYYFDDVTGEHIHCLDARMVAK